MKTASGWGSQELHSASLSCTGLFFLPFSLSDIGRIKFSIQIQERTEDDFAESHLITLLSSSLTSLFLELNMLIPRSLLPPTTQQADSPLTRLSDSHCLLWCIWSFSQSCLLPNLRRFVSSANFTNLPVRELTFTYPQLQAAMTKPMNF